MSLKTMFRSNPEPRDGLTQSQREAIVDLLNYCSFVDREVADSEETIIAGLGSQFDWDPKTSFEYYENKSIGAVRRAIESKDEAFFLSEIRKRLDSPNSRATAVGLCDKLMKSDGKVTNEEDATLAAIKKALR